MEGTERDRFLPYDPHEVGARYRKQPDKQKLAAQQVRRYESATHAWNINISQPPIPSV